MAVEGRNGGRGPSELEAQRRLEDRVLVSIRPALGRRLASVTYCCLDNPPEVEREELDSEVLHFGGELKLRFDPALTLFITWEQGAGWAHSCSVCTRSATAFLPDVLHGLDGSRAAAWRAHLGAKLEAVSVHGEDGVPSIVELRFPGASVLVGVGREGEFGDGDDTIVAHGHRLSGLQGFSHLAELTVG